MRPALRRHAGLCVDPALVIASPGKRLGYARYVVNDPLPTVSLAVEELRRLRYPQYAFVGACTADYVAISIASLWEIAIKRRLGKLLIEIGPSAIEKLCRERDITVLPIGADVLEIVQNLPKIHGDPFDRIIVATALAKGLTIITRDRTIPRYSVKTLW